VARTSGLAQSGFNEVAHRARRRHQHCATLQKPPDSMGIVAVNRFEEYAGEPRSAMSRRVLIVGGYGKAGLKTAEHLARGGLVSEITIAGRNGEHAAKAAARIARSSRASVLGQGLDVFHDEAAARALSAHDIVIMNTDANLERVAVRVARLGKTLISIAAGAACNRALDKLAILADATGALLVSETGLITVLAREHESRGALGELQIVLTLDLIGRHGEEAIAWTLAQLRAAAGFVRSTRGKKLYSVDFADNLAMAARLGLDTASTYLALRPDLPAINLASIAKHLNALDGGLQALSATLETIVNFFGVTTDRVRLDVTISNGSKVCRAVLQGRNQSNLTGAIAARTTEIAIERQLTGSKRMEDLLSFSDADALLSKLGASIELR
jgi:hypothetical protein